MAEDKPSIAYVDEQKDERDNFETDAVLCNLFGEVFTLHPDADLNELVERLLELKIDALITDFRLTQAGPLNYSGEDIVAAFQSVRTDFPCFIRTSFEDDALSSAADVNKIYSKEHPKGEHGDGSLFGRVIKQVEHYRLRIEKWHSELEALLEIPANERNGEQVDRILQLDSIIESSFGADTGIPASAKKTLFAGRDELITETKKLIEEIRAELGD